MIQNLWDLAKAVLRGKFNSDISLPQGTKKPQERQHKLMPTATRKKKQKQNSKLVEGNKS